MAFEGLPWLFSLHLPVVCAGLEGNAATRFLCCLRGAGPAPHASDTSPAVVPFLSSPAAGSYTLPAAWTALLPLPSFY